MSIRQDTRDEMQEEIKKEIEHLSRLLVPTGIASLGLDGRCIAVAKTKLDEFEMWFDKAFEEE